MNNKELQAARRLLFLSEAEASLHIAGFETTKTWQLYESGIKSIPENVKTSINQLLDKRVTMIKAVEDLLDEHSDALCDIAYYSTCQEYKADHANASVIDWRLSQSVAAFYYGLGDAKLS